MSGSPFQHGSGADAAATDAGLHPPSLHTAPPHAYLQRLGMLADDAIDLAHAALALAALDHPDCVLSEYLAHLDAIAEAAGAATSASASVDMQAAAVLEVMTTTFGYGGDSETYDDMRNADMIAVIDRRRGLPVALGILYIHAIRSYGGHVVGLAFPAHFCLRLESRGQRLILDPFEAVILGAQDLRARLKERMHPDAEIIPAYHQSVPAREILLRLQNNIRFRAVRSGGLDRAREIIRRMLLFAPARADLCRELALIHARQGDIRAAIAVVEHFVAEQQPSEETVDGLENLLKRLRAATPRA